MHGRVESMWGNLIKSVYTECDFFSIIDDFQWLGVTIRLVLWTSDAQESPSDFVFWRYSPFWRYCWILQQLWNLTYVFQHSPWCVSLNTYVPFCPSILMYPCSVVEKLAFFFVGGGLLAIGVGCISVVAKYTHVQIYSSYMFLYSSSLSALAVVKVL